MQFQTRARAIDMLGRQQIAGTSTAISELFKNAYDAYATHVEADLLRSDDLLVLRDDGIGMTLDDFANRWLTIATDSKVENKILPKPPIPSNMTPRPTLGEKGIGRLAIATLGSTTLVITRARFHNGDDKLVCALLDWEMFELPGINLSEIDIQIVTLDPTSLPSAEQVKTLAISYLPLLEKFEGRTDSAKLHAITDRLKTIEIDPPAIQERLQGLSLLGDRPWGTHFFVKPVDERVPAQLDLASSDPTNASNLVRLLIGFSNTMTPGHPPVPIETAFRDHRNGKVVDVISEDAFFTPEEFSNADHQIVGSFDEFGTFRGTVAVYGDFEEYELQFLPGGLRRKTECGPFKFSLAIVQTGTGESTIPTAAYQALKQKLDRYGGLYIYNDDIRVLPYGDSRTDFIDVERRRTLNIGRAYFSYRRMFGVVELDRVNNAALKEKAGREGFRENAAFADFRAILIEFFTQTAMNFFSSESEKGARFIERRDKLKYIALEEKKRSAAAKRERNEFERRLTALTRKLDEGEFRIAAGSIAVRLRNEVEAARSIADKTGRQKALRSASRNARLEVGELRLKYQLDVPAGLALTPDQRRDVEAYEQDLGKQLQAFAEPMFFEVERELSGPDRASRLKYIESAVEQAFRDAQASTRSAIDAMLAAAYDVAPRAKVLAEEIDDILAGTRDECLNEARAVALDALSEEGLFDLTTRLERRLTAGAHDARRTSAAFSAQIERLRWHRDGDVIITDLEMNTAVEDRLLALQERADQDLELAQLGLFSQIINHEFVASMTSVRHSIGRLGDYAKEHPQIKRIYEDIHAGFGTLDGYLRLFTPLQRKLYGPRTTVQGRRIWPNIKRVFEERVAKIDATLIATPDFSEFKSSMYPSTLFPVMVNVIDNALYWLERSPKPRRVVVDADGDAILVSNNGPAISERDQAIMFEPGFSRKPDGRGLGLWISQQALKRDGYRLTLRMPQPEMNVTFSIEPMQSEAVDNAGPEEE